jgi:hypothetical protein
MTNRDDSIEDITEYNLSQEIVCKAADSDSWSETINNYEPLKIEEESRKGGIVKYTVDFEGDEINFNFSLSNDLQLSIIFLEALSQGKEFDSWEDIYGDKRNLESTKPSEFQKLIEDNYLSESYQEPLNEFLHDYFWEE